MVAENEDNVKVKRAGNQETITFLMFDSVTKVLTRVTFNQNKLRVHANNLRREESL